MSKVTASRYHDISVGHRVYQHGSKCAHLHGHNYRVHFHVSGEVDALGVVMDFADIKTKLCNWVETGWDHKFLVYVEDPWYPKLKAIDQQVIGIVFNPTAENMAKHLVERVGPVQLHRTGLTLEKVVIEETRKCSATYEVTRG